MADESYLSGADREHTNNHTSTSMCGQQHPATQLPAPVVPGESDGRHDEGGAIVLADVIGPVEQRMDDETEVDPMDFLNTNTYDCDIDMMSQPYDESGYQLANEDMDDMPG